MLQLYCRNQLWDGIELSMKVETEHNVSIDDTSTIHTTNCKSTCKAVQCVLNKQTLIKKS